MRVTFFVITLPIVLAGSASALSQPAGGDKATPVAAQAQSASPAPGASPPAASRPVPAGTAPAAPSVAAPDVPAAGATPQPGAGTATSSPPLPEILRGADAMPGPVRDTWTRLVDAARSGDVERLRPIMEGQKEPPSVAFQEIQDPVEYLKSLSGDAESREILAILLEVLEAGFVHVGAGTPQEMYVWPYFAQYPLDKLTPPQVVELFRLLTSADYEEMRSYGAYIFFRVGITPQGNWSFFVAGD